MKQGYSQLIILKLKEYLEHIKAFHRDFLMTKDDEALHQLRVNIRKSRAILKAFHDHFDTKALKNIDKKLSKIAKSSNKPRDLDVFLDACDHHFALYINRLPISFYERLVQERREEHLKLETFLKSGFVSDAIEEYGVFLENSSKHQEKKEKSFNEVLAKYFNRIERLYGLYLQSGEEEHLHQIRINFKKIRYLLEAFKESLVSEKNKRLMLESKALQKSLGLFNDLTIQKLFLETYMREEEEQSNKAFIAFVQEIYQQKEALKEEIVPLISTLTERY